MKKMLLLWMGACLAAVLLPAPSLEAQNAVCNPFFSTTDMTHWTGTDPSIIVVPGSLQMGLDWYCLRKNPGTPGNNGSVTQSVFLIGGVTYQFSAAVAASYTCPG